MKIETFERNVGGSPSCFVLFRLLVCVIVLFVCLFVCLFVKLCVCLFVFVSQAKQSEDRTASAR